MSSVMNFDMCPFCNEEYWYDFDCKSSEYTKVTMCKCDRYKNNVEEFLRQKKLFEEFEKFHAKKEKQVKREKQEEDDTEEEV